MKIIRNRLKKCWTPTQIERPTGGSGFEAATPGCLAMNRCTEGIIRKPFAAAMAATRSTRLIGSSQSRLTQRERPTRTLGAMPRASGTEPAHVAGSMMSSPAVSPDRYCSTTAGDTLDAIGAPDAPGSSSSEQSVTIGTSRSWTARHDALRRSLRSASPVQLHTPVSGTASRLLATERCQGRRASERHRPCTRPGSRRRGRSPSAPARHVHHDQRMHGSVPSHSGAHWHPCPSQPRSVIARPRPASRPPSRGTCAPSREPFPWLASSRARRSVRSTRRQPCRGRSAASGRTAQG